MMLLILVIVLCLLGSAHCWLFGQFVPSERFSLSVRHRKIFRSELRFQAAESGGFRPREKVNIPTTIEIQGGSSLSDDFELRKDVLQKISKGVIPVTASVGFAVVPSAKVAVRLAGATVGGILGYFAKAKIDSYLEGIDESSEEVRPSVTKDDASLAAIRSIRDRSSWFRLGTSDLEELAGKFYVKEEDLSRFFSLALLEVLDYETSSSTSFDLPELGAIIDYVNEIGYTSMEVGEAFAMLALRIGRRLKKDERGFYKERTPFHLFVQSTKLLFLADKMLSSEFSVPGFHRKRVGTALGTYFSPDRFQKVITFVCDGFFTSCVESVMAGSYTSVDGMRQLRQFLTTSRDVSQLRPSDMQSRILHAVHFALDRELNVTEGNSEKLNDLAEVKNFNLFTSAQRTFGWTQKEMLATMEKRTLPLFVQTARRLFDRVHENPSEVDACAKVLVQQQQALHIPPKRACHILNTIVVEYNSDFIARQVKMQSKPSDGNTMAALKAMVSHSRTLSAFQTMLKEVQTASGLLDADGIPIPKLSLPYETLEEMLQTRESKKRDGTLPEENAAVEDLVDKFFGLLPEQRMRVEQNLMLPHVISWIQTCLDQGALTAHAQEAVQKKLSSLHVNSSQWMPTAVDLYHQEAKKVADARALPTTADMERLKQVRGLLCMNDSDADTKERVNNVHYELLGEKYIRATLDTMSSTGIIAPEYHDGLKRLRDRLELSDEDGRLLTGAAITSRLSPMVGSLVDVWKGSTDPAYRVEKAKNETGVSDPNRAMQLYQQSKRAKRQQRQSSDGLGFVDQVLSSSPAIDPHDDDFDDNDVQSFMREAVNVVDVVAENFRGLNVSFVSGDRRIPITTTDIVAPGDLMGVFQHYLYGRLIESNPEAKKRFQEVEPVFMQLLGLSQESLTKAKSAVAYRIFKSVVRHTLMQRQVPDGGVIRQFAGIKAQLPLEDEEVAEKVYAEACQHALVEHASLNFAFFTPEQESVETTPADKLFAATNSKMALPSQDQQSKPVEPQDAILFRQQVESLGQEIKEIGLDGDCRDYLFVLEVQALIQSRQESRLSELAEAYDMKPEVAAEIMDQSIRRYLSQLVYVTLMSVKRYEEESVMRNVEEILHFATLLPEDSVIPTDYFMFNAKDVDYLMEIVLADLHNRASLATKRLEQAKRAVSSAEVAGSSPEMMEKARNDLVAAELHMTETQQMGGRETVERLRKLIVRSRDFEAPQAGYAALMGDLPKVKSFSKTTWAWS